MTNDVWCMVWIKPVLLTWDKLCLLNGTMTCETGDKHQTSGTRLSEIPTQYSQFPCSKFDVYKTEPLVDLCYLWSSVLVPSGSTLILMSLHLDYHYLCFSVCRIIINGAIQTWNSSRQGLSLDVGSRGNPLKVGLYLEPLPWVIT